MHTLTLSSRTYEEMMEFLRHKANDTATRAFLLHLDKEGGQEAVEGFILRNPPAENGKPIELNLTEQDQKVLKKIPLFFGRRGLLIGSATAAAGLLLGTTSSYFYCEKKDMKPEQREMAEGGMVGGVALTALGLVIMGADFKRDTNKRQQIELNPDAFTDYMAALEKPLSDALYDVGRGRMPRGR
jgi:hypothetical protein